MFQTCHGQAEAMNVNVHELAEGLEADACHYFYFSS